MRAGKERARQSQQPPSQPNVSNEEQRVSASTPATVAAGAGLSTSRDNAIPQVVAGNSTFQPSSLNEESATGIPSGTSPESNSQSFRDVLVDCNALVERYRKGEVSKATVYVEIQSRLVQALGNDRARTDAAFGSFIATVESYDSKIDAAARNGRVFNPDQPRSPSPSVSVSDGHQSDHDGEPSAKRVRVDESAFAWVSSRQAKPTVLRDTLAKTLELIRAYTINPRATKRSLVNELDCPEFPDSEWKNIIAGRAVNLDAVLSGQLSTTNDDTKVEKFGDLEISFGAVEPTKIIKNGGDWSIAWNRTVRATIFAFPHRSKELTNYGEYIVNLFSVTHSSVHNRVIAFDKAVRKRIGNVRNLELSDFERFADLKIAHMDSIGVSVVTSSTKDDNKLKRKRNGENWEKHEPCNKWNDEKCDQAEEDCRRLHVCNKCGEAGHRGKDCQNQRK
jgi:hypothetical protein